MSLATDCIICSRAWTIRASRASTECHGTQWSCRANSSRTTHGTPDVLRRISSHVETKAPLPPETQARLIATRSFHAGLQMMRQLEFALFDFRLHAEYDLSKGARVMDMLREVRSEVACRSRYRVEPISEQLWAYLRGRLRGGYYSYKWAEVLAADALRRV